jgi:hypothetical protein
MLMVWFTLTILDCIRAQNLMNGFAKWDFPLSLNKEFGAPYEEMKVPQVQEQIPSPHLG